MATRREHEELAVITKTYDLILWSCNHTGKFPRNHHFVLGERIQRNLYDLLEALIHAKYTKQRQVLLEKASLILEVERLDLFRDRQWDQFSTIYCRRQRAKRF